MADNERQFSQPDYCAVWQGQCPYPVEVLSAGVVLAYPFVGWRKDWAERFQAAAGPENFPAYAPHRHFTTDYVICKVCKEIRARPVHLSEVSELNWNVFFEAGLAFGFNKLTILAESANEDTNRARSVFPDVLRVGYHHASDLLAPLSQAAERGGLRMSSIVARADPRQLYFLDPGVASDQTRELQRTLKRLSGWTYAAPTGGMSQTQGLHSLLYDVSSAGAVVGLLLPKDYRDQDVLNARSCFLLGTAVAQEKQVLLLVQEPALPSPVDLLRVVRRFASLATMREAVGDWSKGSAAARAAAPGATSSRGARAGEVERGNVLAIDLGNAWAERDPWLDEYFLETAHFRRARDGATTVFLGRRGSGKSAMAHRLTSEIGQGHGIALRSIRPEEFEMNELQDVYRQASSSPAVRAHWQLVLGATWRYLLLTQLARTYLGHYENKAERPPEFDQLGALLQLIPHEDDFVDAVLAVTKYVIECSPEQLKAFMSSMGRQSILGPFRKLSRNTPARLVIDNLDVTWDASHSESRFVLASLIREAERINRSFDARISILLFLRTDIYNLVKLADPDIDKHSHERLLWNTESLTKLVGLRVKYLLDRKKGTPEDAWFAIFPGIVDGIASPDYFVQLTLRRPRELIKLCSAAVESAQSRHSEQVAESDVLAALPNYSEQFLTDLHGEFLIEYPDLYTFVSEFAGQYWPKGLDEMRAMVREAIRSETVAGRGNAWHGTEQSVDQVVQKLYEIGILGLQSNTGRTCFITDSEWVAAISVLRNQRQVRYKRRSLRTVVEEPLVVLHPGLRPVLGAMSRARGGAYLATVDTAEQ